MNKREFHFVEVNDIEYCLFHIESQSIFRISKEFKTKILDTDKFNLEDFQKHVLSKCNSCSSQKDLPNSFPVKSISLNVMQACNMKCIYCYGDGGEYGHKDKMSEEVALSAVDWLISNSGDEKTVNIVFFGGEPLMNFNLIKKVVKYSKKKCKKENKSISFSITTNGTLFSDKVIKFLNENQFSITISIDGNKEIQDFNRPLANGKGSYDLIENKIKAMNDSRDGRTSGRVTVTELNADLITIENDLKHLGFNKIQFTPVTSNDETSNYKLSISKKSLNNIKDYYTKQSNDLLQNIKNRSYDLIGKDKILEIIQLFLSKYKKEYSCGVGRTMAAISCSGDIYPCHRFVGDENFLLGNINETKADLYQEPFINNFYRSSKECQSCFARHQCAGGCIQDNYIANDSISVPNSMGCEILKHQVEQSLKVFGNLDDSDKNFLVNIFTKKTNQKYQLPELNSVTYL